MLALLTDDLGTDENREVITNPEHDFRMRVINLGDVPYIVSRTNGGEAAEDAVRLVFEQENGDVVDVTWEAARRAAQFKSRGGLSFADAFVGAEAGREGWTILTGDPEFECVPEVAVHWLPRKEG